MPEFKSRTLKNLNYFVGKVCSIITVEINRRFEERVAREHFVVLVEEISSNGIWGTHPYNPSLVSFFNFEYIISIQEEEVLNPEDPEHRNMIEEFEKRTGHKLKSDLERAAMKPVTPPAPKQVSLPVVGQNKIEPPKGDGDSVFVGIDSLEKLAEDTRKNYEAYESYKRSNR